MTTETRVSIVMSRGNDVIGDDAVDTKEGYGESADSAGADVVEESDVGKDEYSCAE
jgi:hypothetical protein